MKITIKTKLPLTERFMSHGVTFTADFKLTKSRDRDAAPYDQIRMTIVDDAGMLIVVGETADLRVAKSFVADQLQASLYRHPASHEILARRAQQSLFS